MKKPAVGKLKPVTNKYLSKAANKGRNFEPSPKVTKQTVPVRKVRFSNVKGV